eukprot:Lankesteria_metandrocarpae@DN5290_c0_g1_i1.p1
MSWTITGMSWTITGMSWTITGMSWTITGMSWTITGMSCTITGMSWTITVKHLEVGDCSADHHEHPYVHCCCTSFMVSCLMRTLVLHVVLYLDNVLLLIRDKENRYC